MFKNDDNNKRLTDNNSSIKHRKQNSMTDEGFKLETAVTGRRASSNRKAVKINRVSNFKFIKFSGINFFVKFKAWCKYLFFNYTHLV